MKKILFLNPNSSRKVTRDIKEAVSGFDCGTGVSLAFAELAQAPPGIETRAHIEAVIPLIENHLLTTEADVAVLACFSDPGIDYLRGRLSIPIVGIGEAAYLKASRIGKFGIVSIVDDSIARHRRYLEKLRLDGFLAKDIALGLKVSELGNTLTVTKALTQVVDELVAANAESIVLGCAGLGSYRSDLEVQYGLPVIEPSLAALEKITAGTDLAIIKH